MFEFDSDEDELILDDHGNEVFSSFLYEAYVETGVTVLNKASIASVKHDSLGLIAKRNLHLITAFLERIQI